MGSQMKDPIEFWYEFGSTCVPSAELGYKKALS
jgi:hypothetical protein